MRNSDKVVFFQSKKCLSETKSSMHNHCHDTPVQYHNLTFQWLSGIVPHSDWFWKTFKDLKRGFQTSRIFTSSQGLYEPCGGSVTVHPASLAMLHNINKRFCQKVLTTPPCHSLDISSKEFCMSLSSCSRILICISCMWLPTSRNWFQVSTCLWTSSISTILRAIWLLRSASHRCMWGAQPGPDNFYQIFKTIKKWCPIITTFQTTVRYPTILPSTFCSLEHDKYLSSSRNQGSSPQHAQRPNNSERNLVQV